MTTVAVIGASRGIGLATVKRALAKGFAVRALARSQKPDDLAADGLSWIAGDATDPAALATAIDGTDAVIQTLGIANPFRRAPVTLFSQSTRALVDLLDARGPRRLIVVTGFGAGDSRGKGSLLYTKLFFPLVLARVYDDKDVQEQIVRGSELDWTIVRPGILTNGRATGRVIALAEAADWRLGAISRADVAAFLVDQIADHTYLRKTPALIS